MIKSPSFRLYVLLSLLFHTVMVGSFLILEKLTPRIPKNESVSIQLLEPEQIQEMITQNAVIKKNTSISSNQVVEQSDVSSNEQAPENARFLSAKNQKVSKQTVAQERGDFKNQKRMTSPKGGSKGHGEERSALVSEETKKQIAKDLFKSFDPNEAFERQKLADNKAGLGEGKWNGTKETETGAETSQTNDYLKDIDVGLETVLNTREFKYYSYYNRIRKQLSQHWEGRVREKLSKLFREGRAPAATNKDRITKLMIVLNDEGTLVRVQVLSDSGVRDLDDAAIEAFRAAAPFPNPPEGIVEGDGTVKIRWDFVLET